MLPVDKSTVQKGLFAVNFNLREDSAWYITTPMVRTASLPFYLIEWGHFLAAKDYYTVRKNERFLLFYTLSGAGDLLYNGKHYNLKENTVAIIWCGTQHKYRTMSNEIWDFQWIHYYGSSAQEYYRILGDSNPVIFQIERNDRCAEIIDTITNSNLPNSLTQNLHNAMSLTELMTLLCCSNLRTTAIPSIKALDIVNKSISFMEDNLNQKLTDEMIASSVFLSKYHFIRIFHKATGMSPYQYLTNVRVSKTKELLILTDFSLSEIAMQTGFCDSKSLIYNFKKTTGQTPGRFRRSTCNQS